MQEVARSRVQARFPADLCSVLAARELLKLAECEFGRWPSTAWLATGCARG